MSQAVEDGVRTDEETRQRILRVAMTFFLAHGFSRVTMDEIARELGMSKKTLYQHFESKERLMLAGVDRFFLDIQAGVEAILRDDSLSYPEQVGRFVLFMGSYLSRAERSAILDVRRSAPRVWEQILERRRRIIFDQFGGLIRAGIAAGMVRADLDVRLIVRMILVTIEQMASPETLAELPVQPTDIFRAVTAVIFEGVLTDEARAAARAAARRDA
jgi:AcrR family transcriptional regulator